MKHFLFYFIFFYTFLYSFNLFAENENVKLDYSPFFSYLLNRPQIIPKLLTAEDKPFIESGCPTGFPYCKKFFEDRPTLFTNQTRKEVIVPVSAENLQATLKPGDIIVFTDQRILKEGGLSLALNGIHHTALVGINPEGKLAFTASPKPENPIDFNGNGDGFHILRMKNWAPGMNNKSKEQALAYVQKYFDILYRSDEKSGVVFDYQGDMEILDKQFLNKFAANLKAATDNAYMKDIFPKGTFCLFCSESAVTAYALAFKLLNKRFIVPRAEGLHQGINLVQRDFTVAKKNCKGSQCDSLTLMKKVMSDFFSGEALRVEQNSDNPLQSTGYTEVQKTEMANQMLAMLALGTKPAHAAIWLLKNTKLDTILGDYIRRAMYATSPYDLAVDPFRKRGYFEYVGTYLGPKSGIKGDRLYSLVDAAPTLETSEKLEKERHQRLNIRRRTYFCSNGIERVCQIKHN